MYYYAIDGDDIGRQLEAYVLREEISALYDFSISTRNHLDAIKNYLIDKGCEIVFCEGDSLLASHKCLIELPLSLLIRNNLSFSAGIGTGSALALLALKKAKGLGKSRVETLLEIIN